MRIHSLIRSLFIVAAWGCSNLTHPPSPEPISSADPDQVTSAAPKPIASAASSAAQPVQAQPAPPSDVKVQITDLKVGTGPEAKVGDTITVDYVGTLKDGTKFDSSYDRHKPVDFPLKPGGLIQGWVQGIPGMKVGGKRRLAIPYPLAYGERGMQKIPPRSDLVFEVELLKISPAP